MAYISFMWPMRLSCDLCDFRVACQTYFCLVISQVAYVALLCTMWLLWLSCGVCDSWPMWLLWLSGSICDFVAVMWHMWLSCGLSDFCGSPVAYVTFVWPVRLLWLTWNMWFWYCLCNIGGSQVIYVTFCSLVAYVTFVYLMLLSCGLCIFHLAFVTVMWPSDFQVAYKIFTPMAHLAYVWPVWLLCILHGSCLSCVYFKWTMWLSCGLHNFYVAYMAVMWLTPGRFHYSLYISDVLPLFFMSPPQHSHCFHVASMQSSSLLPCSPALPLLSALLLCISLVRLAISNASGRYKIGVVSEEKRPFRPV